MNTPSELKIKRGTVIPPKEGWNPRTYYIVEVAFSSSNVIHKTLFYSGFLTDSKPCGYNTLFSPNYEENYSIKDVYYLKAIETLDLQEKLKR